MVAERVGRGKTKVKPIVPTVGHGQGGQPNLIGAIFGIRKRLGIDHLERDLALTAAGKILEHVAHSLAIGLDGGQIGRKLGGIVKPQANGFGDIGQDVFGARRQAIEPFRRQIDPQILEGDRGDHIDRDE